ncbi:hypothetical protein [Evansella cellulosilytica]|uniref:hypothetical protein n=1 Tax=Evansella cellulosilytica TaxID=1413 RepID=UPI0002D5B77D|nr:hypothetical protein [Evansella cellulosilytica]
MIAHKGTGVAKRVAALGAGWEIDFFDIEEAVKVISQITPEEYLRAFNNTGVDESLVIGLQDHKNLIESL